MKKFFVINILLLFWLSGKTQNTRITEIEAQLPKLSKSERVPLLEELSRLYLGSSPDKAIDYAEDGLDYISKKDQGVYKPLFYNTLGQAYYAKANYKKAGEYFEDELELTEVSADKQQILTASYNVGTTYSMAGKNDKAVEYYQKSLALAVELGLTTQLQQIHFALYISYENKKDYANSLKHYKEYIALQNQMFNIETSNQITLMQKNVEEEKKKAETVKQQAKKQLALKDSAIADVKETADKLREDSIEKALTIDSLSLQNKLDSTELALKNERLALRESQNKQQLVVIWLMGIIFVLILVAAVFLYRMYRQIQKANVALQQKNEEIEHKNVELEQQKEEILTQAEQLEIANHELEKLSLVASKTDNSVIIIDANGNVEWVNDGFARLYGYEYEEFKSVFGTSLVANKLFSEFEHNIEKSRKQGISIIFSDEHTRKDEEKVWVQTAITPINNADDKITQFIAVQTDITEIKLAEHKIAEQKKDIEDSIRYASGIQAAVLPPKLLLDKALPENFILFRPKDIVSGDFYWMYHLADGRTIVVAADCTGHGVPGGFMSMLGITLLKEIMNDMKAHDVASDLVLNQLREHIIASINQAGKNVAKQDGMDISLCIVNHAENKIQFSGAYNPLFIIRQNNGQPELTEVDADRMPIGLHIIKQGIPFTRHDVEVRKGDALYMFSDGYADQVGGAKEKKFMIKQMRALLMEISSKPMSEQFKILEKAHLDWKGNLGQVDDILVMGFRI